MLVTDGTDFRFEWSRARQTHYGVLYAITSDDRRGFAYDLENPRDEWSEICPDRDGKFVQLFQEVTLDQMLAVTGRVAERVKRAVRRFHQQRVSLLTEG